MKMNRAELAAVLAGLRLLQNQLAGAYAANDVHDIYTDCGSITPLSVRQISNLCQRLNT